MNNLLPYRSGSHNNLIKKLHNDSKEMNRFISPIITCIKDDGPALNNTVNDLKYSSKSGNKNINLFGKENISTNSDRPADSNTGAIHIKNTSPHLENKIVTKGQDYQVRKSSSKLPFILLLALLLSGVIYQSITLSTRISILEQELFNTMNKN